MTRNSKGHILIIDDDAEMLALLRDFFSAQGYLVSARSLAKDAILELTPNSPLVTRHLHDVDDVGLDVIISDIKMPGMNGLEFVAKAKLQLPQVPVILATAFGSIESAIEALKLGAFDYVTKPFKLVELKVTVERALSFRRLNQENRILRQKARSQWNFQGLVGKSKVMQEVFSLVERVAQSNANVLVTGESGTGKEKIARAIHALGPRSKKPFVAINCSAIPDALLESELFGHAKGAFTGAMAARKGLLAEAHGGTLFLDEIGDMSLAVQAKLLRVVQERRIKPVGQNEEVEVDIRLVAATHKDLKNAIKDGNFRGDLFYRLCVIPIVLPPLRQRPEDVILLAEHFLRMHAAQNLSSVTGFSRAALEKLVGMRWAGNVRELENAVERAVVLTRGTLIDVSDLSEDSIEGSDEILMRAQNNLITLDELEQRYVHYVLAKTGGRKEQAAQILGINRRTLYRWEKNEPEDES